MPGTWRVAGWASASHRAARGASLGASRRPPRLAHSRAAGDGSGSAAAAVHVLAQLPFAHPAARHPRAATPSLPSPPSPPNKHSAQRQQLQQLQARRERGGCKRVPALRRAGRAVHCAPHRPRDVRGARVGAPPRLVGAPPPLAWGPRCAPRGGPLQAPFLGEGRTGRPARRAPGGPVRVTCGSCEVAPLGTERLM